MAIAKDFFNLNRQRLIKEAHKGLVVVTAYTQTQRVNDTAHAFTQESNFWYLTGIEAPDWWVIIDGVHDTSWLVSPAISDTHQIFDGSLSAEQARQISGIDDVISQTEALKILGERAKEQHIAYTIGDSPHAEYFDFTVNPAQKTMWNMLDGVFGEVKDCQHELATLRAMKQPAEIEAMKKAIKLTSDAFEYVKSLLPTLQYEYQVEAEFSYYFRSRGAKGHAYDPIVAGGAHACTLHYVENSAKLNEGELLLLDIGAQVDGYSADISRTFSVGVPTERQIAVHASVQDAHKKIIALLKPDLLVSEYFERVDAIMKKALEGLGLLQSPDDYRRYFPHSISHGLGVDVHDSLGGPKMFQPGMVVTVEPGIYIPEEGIGVRIEDDILITETGHENLSASLPTGL